MESACARELKGAIQDFLKGATLNAEKPAVAI
jgi:hypothetical protein